MRVGVSLLRCVSPLSSDHDATAGVVWFRDEKGHGRAETVRVGIPTRSDSPLSVFGGMQELDTVPAAFTLP